MLECACGAASTRHPNVVLIMTDDQGWGDVRSHGNEKIDTPVLDRLASESARFDRFFVCPVWRQPARVCSRDAITCRPGRMALRVDTKRREVKK